MWATKYRPQSFDELVGPVANSKHLFEHGMQHLLLHSREAGVGKTSLAYVIAKEREWPLHIFNASSKDTRGIAFVEQELMPLTRSGNHKQIILLDEADQLTPEAQSALKGVIENSQGFFILTCNNLAKVSEWIKSRCLLIQFMPIGIEDMMGRLAYIAGQEQVSITEGQLNIICSAHKGDLRNSINALQAYASFSEEAEGDKFLHALTIKEFDSKGFLKMCFVEKDYDAAYNLIQGSRTRDTVRSIFYYAMGSHASSAGKLRVIHAAVTTERDILNGVDEDITKANFVRMLLQ